MLTNRTALVGAAISIVVSACGGTDGTSASNDSVVAQDLSGAPQLNQDLAAARAATAKYHDIAVAEHDGYIPASECVASPAGAMGIHYLNPVLFMDPSLDLKTPEALLYLPMPDGRMRLIGIEYIQPAIVGGIPYFGETTPQVDVPSMFGQTFVGPMPGHTEQMPWHSELHVWIWSNNPDGTFAEFNPSLSCP